MPSQATRASDGSRAPRGYRIRGVSSLSQSQTHQRAPARNYNTAALAQNRKHGLVLCALQRTRGGSELILSRSLEFNIRQLILTDLARNIGECKDHASEHDLTPAIDLVTSHVQTRDQQHVEGEEEDEERIFMVRRLLPIHPLNVSTDLPDVTTVRCYDTVQHWIRRTGSQPFGRAFREHHPRPDRHPEGRSAHRLRFILGLGR